MNIFYASCASANNLVMPDSKIWDMNLKSTFRKMTALFEPDFNVGKQYADIFEVFSKNDIEEVNKRRDKYSRLLLESITNVHKKYGLDLFFSYYSSRHVVPEIIDEIKALGIITVNFYCNNIHQFHLIAELAPHYDFCMFPEQEALQKYLSVGAKPVHIQMAANPDFYKPYEVEREYDVTFVGQKCVNRHEYVEYLYRNGVDVHVWGPGWNSFQALPESHVGGPLQDEELIRMYSSSRISLNFSEVFVENAQDQNTTMRHIRLRDFEAPMSGAFYITGYQEELKEYYEIGKEIVCYDTKEELLEKIRYYLKHSDEAEKIRRAGYARALKDHTWKNRFEELFSKIGLKPD